MISSSADQAYSSALRRTFAGAPFSDGTSTTVETTFDRLYDSYLPFRLYVDFMLGSSPTELARRWAMSEHEVSERIEAIRLCLEKQVRLPLLEVVPSGMPVCLSQAQFSYTSA